MNPEPLKTYDDLVNRIHDLKVSSAPLTLNDVPDPAVARDLAKGKAHDLLTELAVQVRKLHSLQAKNSDIARQLDDLHTALVSQVHTDVPYATNAAKFASEGVQGLTRLGGRLADTQANLGWQARALDIGVVAVGATMLGIGVTKLWKSGKNLPWGVRQIWTGMKAVLITAGTLGTGWLAMRYVDNRVAADEADLDNPDRRRANAARFNHDPHHQLVIDVTKPGVNMSNVELSLLTKPVGIGQNHALRFVQQGKTVLVRRDTINLASKDHKNATTDSIQMMVDSIHTDQNGEYVVTVDGKTIYVMAADFREAMCAATISKPTILGGSSQPRTPGRQPNSSVQITWAAPPS